MMIFLGCSDMMSLEEKSILFNKTKFSQFEKKLCHIFRVIRKTMDQPSKVTELMIFFLFGSRENINFV